MTLAWIEIPPLVSIAIIVLFIGASITLSFKNNLNTHHPGHQKTTFVTLPGWFKRDLTEDVQESTDVYLAYYYRDSYCYLYY
jgi:hypothetical protein